MCSVNLERKDKSSSMGNIIENILKTEFISLFRLDCMKLFMKCTRLLFQFTVLRDSLKKWRRYTSNWWTASKTLLLRLRIHHFYLTILPSNLIAGR